MLASVSFSMLLGRNFRPSTAISTITLNLVSNSWRRWSRNDRKTKHHQYIPGGFASTLFLMVYLPQRLEIEITVPAMVTVFLIILWTSLYSTPAFCLMPIKMSFTIVTPS